MKKKKQKSIVLFLVSIIVMILLALVLVFGVKIGGMEKERKGSVCNKMS